MIIKRLDVHNIIAVVSLYKLKNINGNMATMTISYDGRNKVAQNVVALIRSLGDVFHISQSGQEVKDQDWTAEEEREAFLCTSRMNMARWLAENKI